jgi:anion-transporting  ArsA/GET3 family ATPase
MVRRYLELRPPGFRVTALFDLIIEEMERAYVLGQHFSALAASVVTIERMLNDARIKLHQHAIPKVGRLWGKGPINVWKDNIDVLVKWRYLPDDLGQELSTVYGIRRKYLHSDPIVTLEDDSRRCVNAAFRLLTELIGFPERLFRIGSAIECLNESDPLFKVFYKPALTGDHPEGAG